MIPNERVSAQQWPPTEQCILARPFFTSHIATNYCYYSFNLERVKRQFHLGRWLSLLLWLSMCHLNSLSNFVKMPAKVCSGAAPSLWNMRKKKTTKHFGNCFKTTKCGRSFIRWYLLNHKVMRFSNEVIIHLAVLCLCRDECIYCCAYLSFIELNRVMHGWIATSSNQKCIVSSSWFPIADKKNMMSCDSSAIMFNCVIHSFFTAINRILQFRSD